MRRLVNRLTLFPLFGLLVVAPSQEAFGHATGLFRQSTQGPRDARSGAGSEDDVRALDPGKPHRRELAGGQRHAYRIRLGADQFLKAVVEQDGIDVVAQVLGPDGKHIMECDSEGRSRGQESISLVAEVEGDYRLIVQPKEKGAPAGSYQIRIEELRAAIGNDRALHEARGLYEDARKLRREGKYDEALQLVERSLEIRERLLGPDHPDVATAINSLAILHRQKGQYAKAEQLCRRSLAIRESALGPDHPHVADSLNNLASIYYNQGDFPKADLLFRRALMIREKALGPSHLDVAQSLSNLIVLYRDTGEYAKAAPLSQRALAIFEERLGPEHLDVAQALNNTASLYWSRGDYAEAEPLFRRALAIREKALGPEHPNVATSLNNLAECYIDNSDDVKAEPLYQRALAIWEKALGLEHPLVAESLNGLASLYYGRGDYERGETLFQRALTIWEKTLGPEHPDVSNTLSNLARLYAAKGDIARAITFQSRANAVSEHNLALNLAAGSERQKLAYLALFSKETDFTLSLHSQVAPNDPQALNLAFITLLRRKGRGLDAMTNTIAALRRRARPEDQTLFDQLVEARSRLAAFMLKDFSAAKLDTYRARLKLLEEEIEKLEAQLCLRSAELRAQSQPVTLAAVQAALPVGSILIEFALYTSQGPQTGKNKPPRYLAYMLAPQGQPRWVDLGEAASINPTVEAWREALRDPNRPDVMRLARAVDEKVMQPVRSSLQSALADTSHLLIVPDGSLNLIPFAALADEQNQYLIERYTISYLTSGSDLLRLETSLPSKSAPLVLADPAFGKVPNVAKRATQNSRNLQAGNQGPERIDKARIFFRSLPGSRNEALAIKVVLPEASVLLRKQATETALKQAKSPLILHIATHGFFLSNQEAPSTKTPDFFNGYLPRISDPRLSKWAAHIENPLLRSGLALAGANQDKGGDDDGVLTALEVAGLDLWGAKLVVLSACDTGAGEVKNGEGVQGLRRALVLAGSESQVMSLWTVLDEKARRVMLPYYLKVTGSDVENPRQPRQSRLKAIFEAKME